MQKRIAMIIAAMVMGFRQMKADQDFTDFTVGLHSSDELDWASASTLGLQRSAKITKKKRPVQTDDIAPGTSLLGLQRSVRLDRTAAKDDVTVELHPDDEHDWTAGSALGLQRSVTVIKKRTVQTDDIALLEKKANDEVTVALHPDDERDWISGSALGLQRSAKIIKKSLTQHDNIADGTSLLELQRSARVQGKGNDEFSVEFRYEDELDWKSGSALGLQQSAKIIKSRSKKNDNTASGASPPRLQRGARMQRTSNTEKPAAVNIGRKMGASLLGLQHGAQLQKRSAVVEDEEGEHALGEVVGARLVVSPGSILPNATNGTSLHELQNNTQNVKNISDASKPRNLLGLQRGTKLEKVVITEDSF